MTYTAEDIGTYTWLDGTDSVQFTVDLKPGIGHAIISETQRMRLGDRVQTYIAAELNRLQPSHDELRRGVELNELHRYD